MSKQLWEQAKQFGREKDLQKPGAEQRLARTIRRLRKQYAPQRPLKT